MNADGGGVCTQAGDGLQYARCADGCECPSAAPYCATLGLYQGGNFSCNGSVQVCFATARKDCPIGGAR